MRVPITAFFEYVGHATPPPAADPYAPKIRATLDKLPDEDKNFALVVARDYARYHVARPKKTRKAG